MPTPLEEKIKPVPTITVARMQKLRRRVVTSDDGCWLWQGAKYAAGYGRVGIGHHREFLVHRVFYTYFRGPVPDGLHIDHLCRVKHCVNPDHLDAVTIAENNRRKGAARMTCAHGHAYTPENTSIAAGNGSRVCKTCRRESGRRLREKKEVQK